MIDQITAIRALKEAKMPEAQAEAVVQFITDATTGEVATKADLRELGLRIGGELQEMRGDLRLLKWANATAIGLTLIVLAKLFFTKF